MDITARYTNLPLDNMWARNAEADRGKTDPGYPPVQQKTGMADH